MKRERMSLSQVADIGASIVADHMQRCKNDGTDQGAKLPLSRTLDTVEDYMPGDAYPIEHIAVATYVSAALGHEKKRRPKLLVWKDDPYRPLDQMQTYTIEDVEREKVA